MKHGAMYTFLTATWFSQFSVRWIKGEKSKVYPTLFHHAQPSQIQHWPIASIAVQSTQNLQTSYHRSNKPLKFLSFCHNGRINKLNSKGSLSVRFPSLTSSPQLRTCQKNIRTSMSLIPIPVDELNVIIPTPSNLAPTGDQYMSCAGRTPREQFKTLFEGVSVAFLGTIFAFFISFVLGQFFATLFGTILLFWPILNPEFKAYQRNWNLVEGRSLVDVWMDDDELFDVIKDDEEGLYGAYYVTQVEDVSVVDDIRAEKGDEYDLDQFERYTMATDDLETDTGLPWKLRLRLLDNEGREMQIHCRMSEDYLDIQPGMDAVGVLLSTSEGFRELAGMADFCVMEEGDPVAWVGDYPYLKRKKFLKTIEENGIINSLR